MMILALLAMQASPDRWWEQDEVVSPFADLVPRQQFGSGPQTLVISDGTGMVQMEYESGAACQRARDETRRQVAPPPATRGFIPGPASVKAFCVPR